LRGEGAESEGWPAFDSKDNRGSSGITTLLVGRTNLGYSEPNRKREIHGGYIQFASVSNVKYEACLCPRNI